MKNFKPKEILKLKKSQWTILGGKLVTRILEDTNKGVSQNLDSKLFPPYKKSYAILKAAGKATPSGISSDRQTSPSNLRASGKMLGSITPKKATKQSVEIHYREGEIVQGNANPPARLNKGKRNIYGLNNNNWEFARDYINNIIDGNITKFYRKKVILEVKA